MGRAKVGTDLISSKRARRVTYEKRRKGLEKKAQELSTLCGVKVGFIILGSKDSNEPVEATIWPENPAEINSLISSYKMDEKRKERTSDMSMYYLDRTKKAEDELAKLKKKNFEARYPAWHNVLNNLSREQLEGFSKTLGAKMEATRNRIDILKTLQTNFPDTKNRAMIHSFDNSQLSPQHNPYTPHPQGLIRTSSKPWELIRQGHLPSLNPQYGVSFVPSDNSFHINSIAHGHYEPHAHYNDPRMMMIMNDGASISSSAQVNNQNNPATYNLVVPGATEYGGGGNDLGPSSLYYSPVLPTEPMSGYNTEYTLQSSGSMQLHDFFETDEFQFMNQK